MLSAQCVFQGRRDAGSEQSDKLENGLAESSFAYCLLISRGFASVAPEDIFREEEGYIK